MHRWVVREYIDPFESEKTTHYEISELRDIFNYSKRYSSPSLEPRYTIYKFDVIGENVLEKSKLTIFDYLELLKNKSDEIKKNFNYSEIVYPSIGYSGFATDEYSDIARVLGLKDYEKNKQKIKEIFDNHLVSPY